MSADGFEQRGATRLFQPAFYELGRAMLMVSLTLVYRLRRFGLHNMPARGACLIVANHQSYFDPPLVGLCVRGRQFHSVARVGLFERPGLALLIRMLNAIPVEEGGQPDVSAVKESLRRLERGGAVCLFPEGSRTPDGSLQPFQRGAGLIVKRAGCPVVPVAIEGAFDAWPRTRRFPRLFGQRLAVSVGEPIPHEELLRDGVDTAMDRLAREIESQRDVLRRRLGWQQSAS